MSASSLLRCTSFLSISPSVSTGDSRGLVQVWDITRRSHSFSLQPRGSAAQFQGPRGRRPRHDRLPRGRGHTPRHWRRRRKGGRFSRHFPQVSMFTAGKETIPAVSLRLHTHDVLCVAARNLDSPLLRHLSRQRVPVSPAVYLDHSALPAKRMRMEPQEETPAGMVGIVCGAADGTLAVTTAGSRQELDSFKLFGFPAFFTDAVAAGKKHVALMVGFPRGWHVGGAWGGTVPTGGGR